MEEICLMVRKCRLKFRGRAGVTATVLQTMGAIFAVASVIATTGCASRFLQFEDSEKVLQNTEFDSAIKVKELPPTAVGTSGSGAAAAASPALTATPGGAAPPAVAPTPAPSTSASKGKKKSKQVVVPVGPALREPRIEDDEGMSGRRPLIDPFKVGEEVVLDISYFGVDAGELTIQTMPFVEVNGRRAYRFRSIARTVSVFEMFYKVDDVAETLVDYETLNPFSYTLDVKESKLLRDARALHNWQKGRMFFWDKKITKDGGVEEKKEDWEIPAYSQNIFSSLWYLRAFKLVPGKKLKFHMAHEGEVLLITMEVLRQEKLKTTEGELNTVVLRPSAEKNGHKKDIGNNLFWLTDDDRKLMVRLESKIKLGTIVGSLSRIK